MQNKVATLPSSLPIEVQPEVDRFSWSSKRCWKVSITYKTEVFINEEEKEYFLKQLANGKKIIRVGEMILTNKFLAITKIR